MSESSKKFGWIYHFHDYFSDKLAKRNFWRHIVIAQSIRSVCLSFPLRVRCMSPIFFKVGIPNLVCVCILEWRSVAYHFRVMVTLTYDLVF